MTVDKVKLKALAEALKSVDTVSTEKDCETFNAFYKYITPDHVLALLAEIDQLKAENEVLRNDAFFHRHTQRQAELYQNVQMAAGSLPDGWQVVIEIERDAGTVSLLDGDGEAVDEEFGDSSDLADQVAEALKYAVSKEGK